MHVSMVWAVLSGLMWGSLVYTFVPGPWNGRAACPGWLKPVERIVESPRPVHAATAAGRRALARLANRVRAAFVLLGLALLVYFGTHSAGS
jgi:hypothetical protein